MKAMVRCTGQQNEEIWKLCARWKVPEHARNSQVGSNFDLIWYSDGEYIFITINLHVTCKFLFEGRRGNNMLHCAASRGRLVLADWLLDNIFMDNPNVKNDLGETPLHLAAGYFTKGKLRLFTIEVILSFKFPLCNNIRFFIVSKITKNREWLQSRCCREDLKSRRGFECKNWMGWYPCSLRCTV